MRELVFGRLREDNLGHLSRAISEWSRPVDRRGHLAVAIVERIAFNFCQCQAPDWDLADTGDFEA